MSLKNICSIPKSWDLAEYRKHTCYDSSHRHLSRSEVSKLEQKGLVVWFLHPDKSKNESGVCHIVEHVAEVEKIFDQDSFGADRRSIPDSRSKSANTSRTP